MKGLFEVLEPLYVDIHIHGSQPVDWETTLELIDIPELVLELEGKLGGWDVSISLTTDENLQVLHKEWMGDDSVTDIITFNYGPTGVLLENVGELIISVDRTREQAIETGWSFEDELTFLVIHGMLHLCGWQDDDDDSRAAMHARQREIMESAR